MQSLLVLQSFNAMLGHSREPHPPRTIDDFVTRVAEAGFDGLGLVCDSSLPRLAVELLAERDLVWEAHCYPQTVEDLKPALELAGEFGAHHVNLQADVRPSSVAECVGLLAGWQQLADDAGIDLMVETHRNRMTNDMIFTLELLTAFPALKLTGDISHYVVAREMWLPMSQDNDDRMKRILENCWAFHGRVGSSEHIQLPLHFPRSQPWVEQFGRWWDYGFTAWRQRAAPDASLSFLCELIGAPYAMTDADGNEFSDRWHETETLMEMARGLWNGQLDASENLSRPGDETSPTGIGGTARGGTDAHK